MDKKVKKLFFAWGMDKEKAWLESMAKQGWILKSVGFGYYVFYESEPIDLVYEFDFNFLNKKKEEEYLSYFEDWNLIDTMGSWYYFSRERKDNLDLSIFNDNDSKKRMYRRLLGFLLLVGFPLYYQIFFIIPNLDSESLTFPKFYFFFRIIIFIFMAFYTYALLKVFSNYIKLSKKINE